MIINCEVCNKEFYIRPCDYKKGKYRCCSRECSFKNPNRNTLKGESHPNWKGDNVKNKGLHQRIRRARPPKGYCECCRKKTDMLDLANISQEYKTNLEDWEYLCRKCHMDKDGRMNNLKPPIKKGINTNCEVCGEIIYRMPGVYKMYDNHFCSRKCLGIFNKGKNNDTKSKKVNKSNCA